MLALVCALVLAMGLTGCGAMLNVAGTGGGSNQLQGSSLGQTSSSASSASQGGESTATSDASSDSDKSDASQSSNSAQDAGSASGEVTVKEEYLGEWAGLALRFAGDEGDVTPLSDYGMTATLNVYADGHLDVFVTSETEELSYKRSLVEGESASGYTLYDENNQVAGALEYMAGEDSPADYLLLYELTESGEQACIVFYRYR